MLTLPPGKAAGALPVFWRTALFIGAASIHGLGFALVPKASANVQGKPRAPAILQASWIEAAPAETLAAPEPAAATPELQAVAPEPEPVLTLPEPAPAPRAKAKAKKQAPPKPLAKNRPKPASERPADAPEPAAQAIHAPESPSRGEALASVLAFRKCPIVEAPNGSASAVAGAAGQGAPDGTVTPPSHANYLSNPRPDYPASSREQGEQGMVSLYIHVSAEGKTRSVALHKTSGHARLDKVGTHREAAHDFPPDTGGSRGGLAEQIMQRTRISPLQPPPRPSPCQGRESASLPP
jgi:protein TonB